MLESIQLMFITRIGEMTEIGHLFVLLLSTIRVPIPRLYFRFFNFLFFYRVPIVLTQKNVCDTAFRSEFGSKSCYLHVGSHIHLHISI